MPLPCFGEFSSLHFLPPALLCRFTQERSRKLTRCPPGTMARSKNPSPILWRAQRRLEDGVSGKRGSEMKKAVRIAFALSCLAWPAAAQTPSFDDRLARGRAVEAVIWAMPAVNYDLMLQEML